MKLGFGVRKASAGLIPTPRTLSDQDEVWITPIHQSSPICKALWFSSAGTFRRDRRYPA